MGHLKKIVKYITNFLTGFLIFVLFLVIYGKLVTLFSDNAYPNYFGYTFFEVKSGSMEPTLHINDVILIKVTKENLQEKDIIAFYDGKDFITHRIIFVDGDVITVKGDNNNTMDKPIQRDQVIGKLVKVFGHLGIWKKVFMDPKILVFIFVTLLLFDYALSYNKPDSKEKVKKEKKDYIGLIKERINEFKKKIKPIKKPSIKKKVPKEEPKEEKEEVIKEESKVEEEPAPEIIKVEIPEEKEEAKPVKIKEPEKLLELTRKINIEEINKLLEGTDLELSKPEIKEVKQEIKKIEKEIEKEEVKPQEDVKPKDEEPKKVIKPELTKKEKDFLDYTIRLDLSEIQKRIDKRVR